MKRVLAILGLLLLACTAAQAGLLGTGQGPVTPGSATVTPAAIGNYFTGTVADGNTGTRQTIDWSAGSAHTSTINGNVEYYFTPPTTTNFPALRLTMTNSGGGHTRGFPPSPEVSTITTVADVAGSLDGKYFITYDSGNASVCWWYDVDDNGTTEPGGACSAAARDVEITTVVTGDSANTNATNTAAAMEADAQYTATAATNIVTVVDVTSEARTDLTAGTSGFTVAVPYAGDSSTLIFNGTPSFDTTDGVTQLLDCTYDGTDYICGAVPVAAGGGGGTDISVHVYNDADQNCATATPCTITFNSEDFDTTGMHSTVANTSRITIATTGVYMVGCELSYDGTDGDGVRQIILAKNGAAIFSNIIEHASPVGTSTIISATQLISLAATDYAECVAYQDSGSTLAVQEQNGGSGVIWNSPTFWAVKMPG